MISIYINGVACPTVQNDSVLITKSIVDIENPEQKQIDHTKGFLLQDTPAVRLLFGQIFEVNLDIQNTTLINFTPDFNPNLKAKCVVLWDNSVIMSGYCQMTDIVIDNDHLIQYNVNAYASIGNFFNDIKNLKLEDLDFSNLDHNWTKANVIASWSPTLGSGYVYPMINYGLSTNYFNWTTEYFRPALFAKEILDKIFTAAGWNYSSSFLTSTRFKSLIVPFSEEQMVNDNETIEDRSFKVGLATDVYGSGNWYDDAAQPAIVITQDSGTIDGFSLFNDSTTDFNIVTGKWTVSNNGDYKFGIIGDFTMDCTVLPIPQTGSCHIKIVRERSGIRYYEDLYEVSFIFSGSTISQTSSIRYTSRPISLDIGDIVYLIIGQCEADQYFSRASVADGDLDITITDLVFNCVPLPQLVYGDTVSLNNLLPKDYTQVDFIQGICKMFNLYIEQSDDKTLLIEPREDYLTAETVDWTTKIDIGQPVILTPMGMNQQKRYLFSYNQDSDRRNNSYFTAYKEVYGTYLHDVVADFLTETKQITPIFAATPLANHSGVDDKILSDLVFVDQDGSVKQGKSKLRILYWGGLKTCKTWAFYETPSVNGTLQSSYPYAGHLDDPYTPTFDLNFGVPYNVYYDFNLGANGSTTYTDANLFSIYWKQTIKEFTNKNSKVLEAWFNISMFDFVTLSFRKQYFIKEAYYRLLEVSDYDVNGGLTKCKFLKVDREAAHVSSTKFLNGGIATFDEGGKLPIRLGLTKFIDGITDRTDKQFTGADNLISGNNTIIRGSDNVVSNDEVYILGSNNVNVSAERTFVFNSDNQTMLRSGAMINNVLAEFKEDAEVNSAWIQSEPQFVLPILNSTEHYQVTRFYLVVGAGTANYLYTGTGDITLETQSNNVVGTILGVDWLASGEGTIAVGTVADAFDFSEAIDLNISGTYLSGDRDVRIVIFYKIVIV